VVPLLGPGEFGEKAQHSQVLGTRMQLGFSAAHVLGSISMWLHGVSSFAGWFPTHHQSMLLVNETRDSDKAMRQFLRIGFDNVAGSLAGGMMSWHRARCRSGATKTVMVQELYIFSTLVVSCALPTAADLTEL